MPGYHPEARCLPFWPPLRLYLSLQGWVFNVVPWLLAIPASPVSGFLSDRLISQGECWGKLSLVNHCLRDLPDPSTLAMPLHHWGKAVPPSWDRQTILQSQLRNGCSYPLMGRGWGQQGDPSEPSTGKASDASNVTDSQICSSRAPGATLQPLGAMSLQTQV